MFIRKKLKDDRRDKDWEKAYPQISRIDAYLVKSADEFESWSFPVIGFRFAKNSGR